MFRCPLQRQICAGGSCVRLIVILCFPVILDSPLIWSWRHVWGFQVEAFFSPSRAQSRPRPGLQTETAPENNGTSTWKDNVGLFNRKFASQPTPQGGSSQDNVIAWPTKTVHLPCRWPVSLYTEQGQGGFCCPEAALRVFHP